MGQRPPALYLTTGGTRTTYAYDADGIRSSKTVGSTVHTYLTQSGKVVRETIGSGSTAKVLDFIYDESGKPFALKYSTNNGSSFTTYYYVLNLQGDVVKLVTSSGTAVATYTYDAWGNLLTSSGTMASVNPLRYRGYYYDTETGFYYLQSRYYDPANHRFLNADVYASTDSTDVISCNMFAYCRNNPVMNVDFTGHMGLSLTIAVTNWWNPVGWIFAAAVAVVTVVAIVEIIHETPRYSNARFDAKAAEKNKPTEPETPDVTYPGDDPTKAPEGTTWRGRGEQGSKQGNYHNPETGESWHPDLDHAEPIGPHWDYKDPNGTWWRIGSNDTITIK